MQKKRIAGASEFEKTCAFFHVSLVILEGDCAKIHNK